MTRQLGKQGPGPVAGVLAMTASLVVLTSGAMSVDVDEVHEILQQRYETQRLISAEKKEWARAKELQKDRIEALEVEVGNVRNTIQDTKDSIAEAEKGISSLVEEEEALKASMLVLDDSIAALEGRARSLIAKLPGPAKKNLEKLIQRLPDDSSDTKLEVNDRYLNVVGVLNEVEAFNRKVSIHSEVLVLSSGEEAEVTTLYFGVGLGYYISEDGKRAGMGSGVTGTWTWTPKDDAAEAVRRAVDIFKLELEADYVQLPVRIE